MMSTTITVRLPTEVKDDLDWLAAQSRRSRSFLAAEAVAAYVAEEKRNVEGILQGRADFEAGRTVSHEEAIGRLRATIDQARTRKAA